VAGRQRASPSRQYAKMRLPIAKRFKAQFADQRLSAFHLAPSGQHAARIPGASAPRLRPPLIDGDTAASQRTVMRRDKPMTPAPITAIFIALRFPVCIRNAWKRERQPKAYPSCFPARALPQSGSKGMISATPSGLAPPANTEAYSNGRPVL